MEAVDLFLAGCVVLGPDRPGERVRCRNLYDAFLDFATKRRLTVSLSRGEFNAAMMARGYRQIHSNGHYWRGLRLIEDRLDRVLGQA